MSLIKHIYVSQQSLDAKFANNKTKTRNNAIRDFSLNATVNLTTILFYFTRYHSEFLTLSSCIDPNLLILITL